MTPTPGITVVCGGCEHCDADYRIRRSTFPHLAVELVAEGRGRLELAGRSRPLSPGSVFSYGPEVRCHIDNDPAEPMRKYFVDFVGAEAERLLRETPLGIGGAAQAVSAHEIVEVFDDLHREGTRGTPLTPDVCAVLLRLLLLKITEGTTTESAPAARALETYRRCKQHIDRHDVRLRTLEQIALETHVDLSYLCRLFKRFDRVSPYKYLMRRKMNRAVDLLLGAGLLVKQVAREVGFDDPYHFSRVFKSVHGVSPTRFLELGHRTRDGDLASKR